MNLGQFEVWMIKDGGGTRATSTFMPDAPQDQLDRVVRQQGLDPNAFESSITPLVIQDKSLILVDTGLGGDRGNLPAHLEENGVYTSQIDTIVITHGHWDHIGGILDANGDFVFPNAEYVLWQTEWDYWTAEDRFTEESTIPGKATWDTLLAHRDRVRLIGGTNQAEAEILPGICAIAAPGHTVGHIALELTSGGKQLLHIADAAHHWFQLQCPQWSPHFDYDKAQAAKTRQTLFERAARSGSLLSAYHFPFPGIGRVVERDGRLVWEQVGA